MADQQFALVTQQGGRIKVYSSPDVTAEDLVTAGQLLAAGADPPMETVVVVVQEAKWDAA